MTIEVEIKEIKNTLGELSKKLDALIRDRKTSTMMTLSEQSLKDFLSGEPELYSGKTCR